MCILEENGWTIVCESPFEIEHEDGDVATGYAAKIIESSYESDWIRVEDAKPEHDQEVITYSGDTPKSMPAVYKMGITRYTKGEREFFYGGRPDEGYQVTHWMPRPLTPTGR